MIYPFWVTLKSLFLKVSSVSVTDLTPNKYFPVHIEQVDPFDEPRQKNYTTVVIFTELGLHDIIEDGYSDKHFILES